MIQQFLEDFAEIYGQMESAITAGNAEACGRRGARRKGQRASRCSTLVANAKEIEDQEKNPDAG